MLIVADEDIPYVREAFGSLGEVSTSPGRKIAPELVRDAELLLVRSVSSVGAELLEGSRVSFVGTATAGIDHVDTGWLAARGIAFASAPGSNARSVAEYLVAALLALEDRGALTLCGSTLGVVGAGEVGSRVARLAEILGMRVLVNDPPRARREGPAGFVPLDEIAASSDAVTFHVPLDRAGPDATYHMLGEALLAQMRPGAAVINTARGAVADSRALAEAKRSGRLGALVLDVWEGEPAADPGLVGLADIATPHVAGYSFDGKVAGTRMVHEAACRHLGRPVAWPGGLPPVEDLRLTVAGGRLTDAVRAAYDIQADDARMRQCMRAGSAQARAEGFAQLRRDYPIRREFACWRAIVEAGSRAGQTLRGLGFHVEDAPGGGRHGNGRTR